MSKTYKASFPISYIVEGEDGTDGLSLIVTPTHHSLSADSGGALSETLGLGGDTDTVVSAYKGTTQIPVVGLTLVTSTNCSVSYTISGNEGVVALLKIGATERTIGGLTATVPIPRGSFTFTATLSDGDNTYTTGDITVTFAVDYSVWIGEVLDTSVQNSSELANALVSLTNIVSVVSSSLELLCDEVVAIGAAAGVEGYDDGTDPVTTTISPSLSSVSTATSTLSSELSGLQASILACEVAETLTIYQVSTNDLTLVT